MKRWILIGMVVASGMTIQAQNKLPEKFPYQDTSLTAEERADDLLKRLTLEEKASLMMNGSPAIPRLSIKAYGWWNEALHGLARTGLATVFPQAIGMGASFDDSLLYEVFTAVSDEARAKSRRLDSKGNLTRYQALTVWTPNVNIFRDPRWGRGQETYGEDPYLTSRLGVAVVNGLQGPDTARYNKLHACAKHYAVHSGPEWNRHSFNAENISLRDLWETYLPAFKTLVQEAKVKEVMCAYNRFEGEPCCGSNRLLTQILRDEWGFDGVVVSDCGAVSDFWQKRKHETHPDAASASADAVLNGTDVECGNSYKSLPDAVKAGLITENQIDISVKRLLKARFELGEMDENVWTGISSDVVDSPKHRQLALQMARETMTLLQNNNNILPLSKQAKIALIGPNANDSVMQWGNYNGLPSHTITLLEGMQRYLPTSNLIYEPVCGHTDSTLFISLFNKCSTSEGNGFHSTYWNNNTFTGEAVTEVQQSTPFLFNTNGAAPFAPGVILRGFSAEYRSVFHPEKTEDVVFRIQMRGAYELYINGKLVKEDEGAVKQMTSIYTLKVESGKSYDILLKYRHFDKTANLSFDMGVNAQIDVKGLLERIKDVDVVIFAGGISPALEGEEMPVDAAGFKGGDRTEIELPAVQRRVVEALKTAGKRIVFVNFSGAAIALEPESQNCEAILQAWYPGQAGGQAVAEVLFGDYNPAGKLPLTFYRNLAQIPDFEDYNMTGRTYRYMKETPLFPFGHGLSYTTFKYGKLKMNDDKIAAGQNLNLVIPVTNTGSRDGDEVVQVYLKKMDDTEGPVKTLRAFKRVRIPAGKTVEVKFSLNDTQLEWWDEQSNTMRVCPGNYTVMIGGTSCEKSLLSRTFTIR